RLRDHTECLRLSQRQARGLHAGHRAARSSGRLRMRGHDPLRPQHAAHPALGAAARWAVGARSADVRAEARDDASPGGVMTSVMKRSFARSGLTAWQFALLIGQLLLLTLVIRQ